MWELGVPSVTSLILIINIIALNFFYYLATQYQGSLGPQEVKK